MDYKIEEIVISSRLEELGLKLPDTLVFLPENLDSARTKDEFIFTDSMLDLNKIFKQEKISVTTLGNDTELYRSRKNADIYLPAMFFGCSLIIENPTIVSISLNVLSNFIYDHFKGTIGRKTAHIDFYIETHKTGKIKKLSYNGDIEGLKDVEKIIETLK
jgi:hypothetical protein